MMCKAHGIRFNKKVTIQNWSARFSIIISTVPVIWLIQRETAQILHIRVCFQVLMSTTAYGGRATYRKGVHLKSLDLKQGWNAVLVSTLCYTMMKLYFSLFFVACVSDKARHGFRFFWQQKVKQYWNDVSMSYYTRSIQENMSYELSFFIDKP